MTKEVEDIIRSKAYHELTNEERGQVGELAQNEEEYANMQWFLTGSAAAFEANKIQASPKLKQGVMDHLTAAKKKKGFWLNSVGVFLMPADKKFYQKPAFQMGIAATAIIGFLFFINPKMDENNLALNTPMIEKNDEPNEVSPLAPVSGEKVEDELRDQDLIEDIKLEEALEQEELTASNREGLDESADKLQSGYFIDDQVVETVDEVPLEAPVIYESLVEEELSMEDSEMEIETVSSGASSADEKGEVQKAVELNNSNRLLSFKRDRNKDKSVQAEPKKKVGNPSVDAEADLDNVVLMEDKEKAFESEPGNALGGALSEASETIYPKSLHIKQTSELNFLFHLAK